MPYTYNRVAGKLYNTDLVTIAIPTGKIFHQTDWDARSFERALERMAGGMGGGILISAIQRGGFLKFVFEIPSQYVGVFEDRVMEFPSWEILKQYGAEISDEPAG
jgi:hypothetical protein